jgi:hypothetical protein
MERRQRIGSVLFGVGCSFISSVAKLLFPRRSLFLFIPIWVPRDLSVRDSSHIKKEFALFFVRPKEVNLKLWLDRSKKRKRQKELRELFLVVSTKIRSTGSFVEWNEGKELGVSCSALVAVSFPP